MVQFIGFVLVLAAVYALKAISVVRAHGSLAEKAAAFSWARPREEDVEAAASWAKEEEHASKAGSPVSLGTLRHVGGVRA